MKAGLIVKIVIMSLVAAVLIGVLVFGLTTGFGLGSLIQKQPEDYSNTYTYTADPTKISKLNIAWSDGFVELRYYDGAEIRVTESAPQKLKENNKLLLETNGSTLKIAWNDQSWVRFFSWFNQSKGLLVELPRGLRLNMLEINGGAAGVRFGDMSAGQVQVATAGKIEVVNLQAESMDLTNVAGGIQGDNLLTKSLRLKGSSGDIAITNAVADSLVAETVSGEISILGSFYAVKSNSVSGNVTIATGVLPATAQVSVVSGAVAVGLPENEGFLFHYASVTGALEKSEFSIEKNQKQSFYKNAAALAEVTINTTSGGISLDKVEAAAPQGYSDWKAEEDQRIAAEIAAAEAAAAEATNGGA